MRLGPSRRYFVEHELGNEYTVVRGRNDVMVPPVVCAGIVVAIEGEDIEKIFNAGIAWEIQYLTLTRPVVLSAHETRLPGTDRIPVIKE